MKKYPKKHIASCRSRIEANLLGYRKQVGKPPSKDFEACYFNDQVFLFDYMMAAHGRSKRA